MRIVSIALVAAALTGCTKKSQSEGLPPAAEWSGGGDTTGAMVPMTPGGPAGAPHTAPHAGADPSNPHAGLGLNADGTPADPTATANPHAGGGSSMANVVPEQTDPRTLEKLADGRLVLGPFTMVLPKDWTNTPATSSMRTAQFTLAAPAGAEAELVVYYFGETGAGSIQDNTDRWVGQFGQPDGKSAKDAAKIETTKVAGQDATIVSVVGHYAAPAMMAGAQAVDKPDQELLGAIIASPSGPYYFKLVGAKKTVDANNAAFRGLLSSLKIR